MRKIAFLKKNILLFLIALFFINYSIVVKANDDTLPSTTTLRGKVLDIIALDENTIESSAGNFTDKRQMLRVKILNGKYKDTYTNAIYSLNYGFNENYELSKIEVGDEVLLFVEESPDGTIANAYVTNIAKDKYLLYLLIIFVVLLLFIGRMKGFKAIVSLTLTIFAIIKVMFPLILKGHNPILVSVLTCSVVITISLLIISGFNKKTLSAIIGTTTGVIIAGLIALIIGNLAKLSGLNNDESMMLMYIPQEIQINFKGLLFAGIIIGSMGATMDVGISIASSMHELKAANPDISKKDLFKAGMNVGQDIMGTMSNTLILAYAGGSIQLVLLIMAHKIPFIEVINRDAYASEIVRALAGSIGLIFTIPVTVLVSTFLYHRAKTNLPENKEKISL